MRKTEDEIRKLQNQLNDIKPKIHELYKTNDKTNAIDLNSKVNTLLRTLLDFYSKRKESAEQLENAQEGWTFKLKLFTDEASRDSREAANAKAINEILGQLEKVDNI